MQKINFIGCGKLGKTLGRLIHFHGLGQIEGILTSSQATADLAAEFIQSGKGYTCFSSLPLAEIYFLTTKDELIEKTFTQLIAKAQIQKGAVFIHCSGVLSSEILKQAKKIEAYAISVHPLKSFANPKECINNFKGTFCAYEGDLEALSRIAGLFNGIGAVLTPINKAQKILYHAATVMANNYLVSLHQVASQCYQKAGFSEELAHRFSSMMMGDALRNLQTLSHEEALTGPLQRGDRETIKQHLKELDALPLIKTLYQNLGKLTLPITTHSFEQKNSLNLILQES